MSGRTRKIGKLPKINNFFYLGIFIFILKVYGSASSILPFYNDIIDTCLSLLGSCCMVIHCIQKRFYNTRTFLIYVFVACLSVYSIVVIGNYNIFITVITCFAIRGEKTADVIEFLFRYELLFFSMHLIYAFFRMLLIGDDYMQVISGVARYNMGLGHPNRFSIFVFNLLLMWIWLNFSTIRLKNIVIIFLISLLNYEITKTRTNEIAIMILLVILLLYKVNSFKMSSCLKNLAMLIVPALEVCSVAMVILYSYSNSLILDMLDKILSARIRLGAYGYNNYGITFLGQHVLTDEIQYDTTYRLSYFTFDNIYTDIAIQQGLIWVVIVSILFFLLARKKNDASNFAIIAWGIYGITEVHGLNVYMLFVVLLVNELFQNKKPNLLKGMKE